MTGARVRPGRSPVPARARPIGQAGFTLIEVLAVVAVMGLALGLVVSRGPTRSAALEMQAATRQVTQTLRLARAMAISRDRPVLVAIDGTGHSLRIAGEPPRMLPAAVSLYMVPPQGRPPVPLLRFNGDGSATGGPLELADSVPRVRVAVDWLTGRVSARPLP